MIVVGVLGNLQLYYMGVIGGGVWKIENVGLSWQNLFDGYFGVGIIGVIVVVEFDFNVFYVGMGEKLI